MTRESLDILSNTPVGETVEVEGRMIRVERRGEMSTCEDCFFSDSCEDTTKDSPRCLKPERGDGIGVHFVEITNTREETPRRVGGGEVMDGVQMNEIPNKFKKAPFPYFGGKSRIADEVWARLGSPTHYVEPFCGSAAMLLASPAPCSLEVVNDMNHYIANFWRCIKYQPDAVYIEQDYPVSHVDLDARHVWLTNPERVAELRAKLADPEWCGDARIAGWWVWGQCCWIGSGWCEKEIISDAGVGVQSKVPHISDAGVGVQSKVPHIGNAGSGVQSKVPHIGNAGSGVQCWLRYLSHRLERVRILHGDWSRCLNSHYGDSNGGTAYFFDPPYLSYESLYANGASMPVAHQVEGWCRDNAEGHRIALCGHIGDYDLPGWSVLEWDRGRPAYGGSKTTDQECIWFSPDCISPDCDEQLDIFNGGQQ